MMTKFRGWPESAFDFSVQISAMDTLKTAPTNEWLAQCAGPSTLPPPEPDWTRRVILPARLICRRRAGRRCRTCGCALRS